MWINTTTGDTLHTEEGNATVDITTRRQVAHYNNYKRYSIPLELGFRKNYNKMEYGVRAGSSFNFTIYQDGRTFNKNLDIIDFDKDSSVASFKSFGVGIRINPYIGYKYTNNLSFRLHPQWTWSAGNNFDGTDIKLNIHQFNLNIGVSYSFD